MKWLQFVIPVSSQIEEACMNRLQELGASAVSNVCPNDSSLLLYGIFSVDLNQNLIEQEIRSYLSSLKALGLEVRTEKIIIQEIDEDEYLHTWEEFFQPLHINDMLVIEPVWRSGSGRSGEKVLKIDPAMAFGTGHHFTTQFCLTWICEHKNNLKSLIDIGCGSGILAIAASLLGVEKVLALDYDTTVIPNVLKNMKENGLLEKIMLLIADVLALPIKEKFEAVVANLHTTVLLAGKERLTSLVKPGGSLVLTGIGYPNQQEILTHYSDLSLQAIHQDPDKEWVGLWYTK